MRIHELLTESLSRVAYHYTNFSAGLKILTSGKFELSSSLGAQAEQEYMIKGKPYFLSTTRTKLGGYHHSGLASRGVLFVLDGDWFNQHYTSKPIDYWGNRGVTGPDHRASEAEDRIYSSKPTIPIAGVTSVHIFLEPKEASDKDTEYDNNMRALAREMLIQAKTRGIKAYFYTDRSAWLNLDTKKTSSVTSLSGPRKTSSYRGMHRTPYLKYWVELLQAQTPEQLSKEAKKIHYDLARGYTRDIEHRLNIDMSNARKPDSSADREYAVKIIKLMRQHRLNNLKELTQYLSDKWKYEKN